MGDLHPDVAPFGPISRAMHFVRMLPSRAAAPAFTRAFRATARAAATPMSPLEQNNHLEPVYAAMEDRLSAVRKK